METDNTTPSTEPTTDPSITALCVPELHPVVHIEASGNETNDSMEYKCKVHVWDEWDEDSIEAGTVHLYTFECGTHAMADEISSSALMAWNGVGLHPDGIHDFIYVESIEIDPVFRGHGLGAKALDLVLEALRAEDFWVGLLPSPLDEMNADDQRKAAESLDKYWRGFGFVPSQHEVTVLVRKPKEFRP